MKKEIYLDYAGATPLDPRVKRVVLDCMKNFGNASSVHRAGRQAKAVIDQSRKKIAGTLGSRPVEIIFTASGTEADNLAIFGVARAHKKLGRHIVTSKIEHPAVIRACQYLENKEGFKITRLDIGQSGIVELDAVRNALRPDTILVSIMYANNEIGTIQPIAEIAKIVKKYRGNRKIPFFHVDACQAAGALYLNVQRLGIDLMTLNGSKIYGPKGIGCLYARQGVELTPMIFGGSQERGLRAGTENPALIAGFAKALELADGNKVKENKRLTKLRDYAVNAILKTTSARLNGDPIRRLPNNINVSFGGVNGEMLMLALDRKGVQVSTGSACFTASGKPSSVLKALGLSGNLIRGSIRITLGRLTTKKDIDYFLRVLPPVVKKLA